ncbi:MAG: sulfur oxidation c-type cytochrome SoxX [Rhodospirillales bacterium]
MRSGEGRAPGRRAADPLSLSLPPVGGGNGASSDLPSPPRGEGPWERGSHPRTILVALALLLLAVPAAAADAERGRAIVVDRTKGLCLLCHSGPFPEQRAMGTLAPDLAGVGARLTLPEIRQRLADPAATNPDTVMPSYARTDGLVRVAGPLRGRPIVTDAEIADVAAFLATLK